jgi:hypothetical protein
MARPVLLWSQTSSQVQLRFENARTVCVSAPRDGIDIQGCGDCNSRECTFTIVNEAESIRSFSVQLFDSVILPKVDTTFSSNGRTVTVRLPKAQIDTCEDDGWTRLTHAPHRDAPFLVRSDWDAWNPDVDAAAFVGDGFDQGAEFHDGLGMDMSQYADEGDGPEDDEEDEDDEVAEEGEVDEVAEEDEVAKEDEVDEVAKEDEVAEVAEEGEVDEVAEEDEVAEVAEVDAVAEEDEVDEVAEVDDVDDVDEVAEEDEDDEYGSRLRRREGEVEKA